MTSIDSLPEELFLQILLLLPPDIVYQIARFVCHKWYNIIHSHDFTLEQISRSTNGLLLQQDSESASAPIYVTAIGGRIQAASWLSCRGKILASANGLIVELHHNINGEPSLHVTNPATKQQPFFLPPIPTAGDKTVYHEACCLAYSSAASMVYKLTLPYSVNRGRPLGWLPGCCTCLHILTAGVDKSWRDVEEVSNLTDEERSFFLSVSPLPSEGFLHWVVGIRVLTFNVETETFTFNTLMAPEPSVTGFSKLIVISTGRNLAAFLGTDEFFFWETWEMERESGEWRKMVGLDVDLRPLKSRLQLHFASGDGNDMCWVVGWVKYAEVLAFRYWHGSQNSIICYNLDTHEINTVETLLQLNAYIWMFPHRNSPVWLS